MKKFKITEELVQDKTQIKLTKSEKEKIIVLTHKLKWYSRKSRSKQNELLYKHFPHARKEIDYIITIGDIINIFDKENRENYYNKLLKEYDLI